VGVSVANAGPVVTTSNSAVAIGAGMAHRNFGETEDSASMKAMSVLGGNARSSDGIEDSTARNLISVHDRIEPRTAGDDTKNRKITSRTNSGSAANKLENLTSTSMRALRVGGGREASA